jgi:hypothetical protein
MTKKEFAKEVGIVAAIMSDTIFEKLYKVCQQNGTGYITTAETISEWVLEFVLKNKQTNWEDLLEKGIVPLSKEISEVICWDDAIFDYAHYKLEQLKN